MTEDVARYQPKPKQGLHTVIDCIDLQPTDPTNLTLLGDLRERAKFGKEKHGTYLMSHNGRDALMDAYQEALDAIMYTKQDCLENPYDWSAGEAHQIAVHLAQTLARRIERRRL
jgi:hypothetical protein